VSADCRPWAPARLVLLEASEHPLYQIDQGLLRSLGERASWSPPSARSSDAEPGVAIARHAPGRYTIYHAAAHKHVPLVEANVLEGARNNVLGT
jgi:FlaA1/EpsC-like NDP-sugar epimerase